MRIFSVLFLCFVLGCAGAATEKCCECVCDDNGCLCVCRPECTCPADCDCNGCGWCEENK